MGILLLWLLRNNKMAKDPKGRTKSEMAEAATSEKLKVCRSFAFIALTYR